MTIVTLTMNPSLDIATSIDKVMPIRKLRCGPQRRDPGGGGINVARAVRFLGGEAMAMFPSGGLTGKLLEKLLHDEGVPIRAQETAALCRESFTVVENKSGQEYRFVFPGPELQEKEWQRCLDMLTALTPLPGYVVASGSLPPGVPEDFYGRVAHWAYKSGVRMILDTSGAALKQALDEGVHVVKPNLRELQDLTGKKLPEQADQEAASRELIDNNCCQAVALTLGENGALLTWAGGSKRVRVPEVEVKSAVGAGDSFVAGMVLALERGESLQQAFCFGAAAGTAALLTPGTELCRRQDAEELYRQICAQSP